MRLNLKQLEVLNAIVLAGSISGAKRALGLSQPTISQQLAKMEEALGTQLIHRGRGESLRLTAAGEYWYKVAARILSEMDHAEQEHHTLFEDKRLTLHFGTTPSLRGRFTEVAAQIALELGHFSRFDFDWGVTSDIVVENINAHNFNCGVVSAASIEGQRASLHVEFLCRDQIVWAVPAELSDDCIAQALDTGVVPEGCDALTRYVDVTPEIPWRARSDNWFRTMLPGSSPFFGCITHHAAVDVVAAGLATCHTPMSLLPNLPEQVRSRIKVYDIGAFSRDVVFVMPKHLLSLRPFAEYANRLCAFMRENYGDTVLNDHVRTLPRVTGRPAKPRDVAEPTISLTET